jgi:hypothetical protein
MSGDVVVFPKLWHRDTLPPADARGEVVQFPAAARRAPAIGECAFLPFWRTDPDSGD